MNKLVFIFCLILVNFICVSNAQQKELCYRTHDSTTFRIVTYFFINDNCDTNKIDCPLDIDINKNINWTEIRKADLLSGHTDYAYSDKINLTEKDEDNINCLWNQVHRPLSALEYVFFAFLICISLFCICILFASCCGGRTSGPEYQLVGAFGKLACMPCR